MFGKVRDSIQRYRLFRKGEKVIVGFSGGIDSVCLLTILHHLKELELDLWGVYVNHGLRPLENQKENDLLLQYGEKYQIHTKQIEINIPQRLKDKPQSLQLLARNERYRVLEEFRQEISADKIALAHHHDDQAETILYRVIRGTGIDGLAGIPIIRDGIIVRPLLEVSRAEIREYVSENQLNWVEDSSNQKLIYRRNKIRHNLIPLIEAEYNPRFKNALLRLGKIADEQHDLIEELIGETAKNLITGKNEKLGIKLAEFYELHPYLQYSLLKQVLTRIKPDYHLESVQLLGLRDKINEEKNQFKPIHIYRGIKVYYEENLLCFTEAKNEIDKTTQLTEYPLNTPGVTHLSEISVTVETRETKPPFDWKNVSPNEVFVDVSTLNLPLRIRFWSPGDFFRPLGGPGVQKLQDFFTNLKIPRHHRKNIPLMVTSDNRIIWVVGHRLSEDFKIKETTKQVWQFSVSFE